MHYAETGREFIHGLTHELDTRPEVLDAKQTDYVSTWAVSIINGRGAFGVGQVWCDPDEPKPDRLNPVPHQANRFPDGAVQGKLLFTTATVEQVPWLEDSLVWKANVNSLVRDASGKAVPCQENEECGGDGATCNLGVCFQKRDPNQVSPLLLMQVDVAVRDNRFPETGWAFGTFAYNRNWPGETVWDRLVPIGLMWGNDPGITQELVDNGARITESWINQEADPTPSPDGSPIRKGIFNGGNHLGYAGRLNGPADNPSSACMSCHMTSGLGLDKTKLPTVAAPIVYQAVDYKMPLERRLNWFLNIPAGVPWSYTLETSLDYQLQLSIGILNFYHWKSPGLTSIKPSIMRRFTRSLPLSI